MAELCKIDAVIFSNKNSNSTSTEYKTAKGTHIRKPSAHSWSDPALIEINGKASTDLNGHRIRPMLTLNEMNGITALKRTWVFGLPQRVAKYFLRMYNVQLTY